MAGYTTIHSQVIIGRGRTIKIVISISLFKSKLLLQPTNGITAGIRAASQTTTMVLIWMGVAAVQPTAVLSELYQLDPNTSQSTAQVAPIGWAVICANTVGN